MKRPPSRYAKTLLDACICHTGWQGGTIHQFLPRLSWKWGGNVARQGPTWHLMLDDKPIGWYAGTKANLPPIEPGLHPGHLDLLFAIEPL